MIDWDSLVVGPTTDIFGEPVRYRPVGGVVFDLTGVFDEGYLPQDQITGLMSGDVANTQPVLGVQLSSFPAGIAPDDEDVLTVTRTGESFVVTNVEADGKGGAMLTLNTTTLSVPL